MDRKHADFSNGISLASPLPRKINLPSLTTSLKEWLKHPANIAILVWSVCVSISSSMLGLLVLGVLDHAFPSRSSRNQWIEINNQVLNALFTLMSLYQHPHLFYHLVLLCRWRSEDIRELRNVYSTNGAYRPYEWTHMMVVITLLHITCFSQYVMCGLFWGYTSSSRPEFAEDFFFVIGTAAPIFAGVYTLYGPLGREHNSETDEESQSQISGADIEQSSNVEVKLSKQRIAVSKQEWAGGLFDCRNDLTVCLLSFFCTFCIFGWNMERLKFGNRYVHIVTFILLCFAPFWIFNISALNIQDKVIGDMIGIAGIVLCAFGLLYGGFWRIQLRNRYKLPGSTICCGSTSLTDYIQWMFCWPCSLAQEVRTGNVYNIEDDSASGEESNPFLQPLPREGGWNTSGQFGHNASLAITYAIELPNYSATQEGCTNQDEYLHMVQVDSAVSAPGETMRPPVLPSMQSE
ncbi:uncharacterized protein [Typha angustifolia]|uniref:uncharacterized protein isoform X1 n=2 Tax=Typha angustifolia TaxID=59011 RepID=UPI003C2AD57D